jgi:hypothetical protein
MPTHGTNSQRVGAAAKHVAEHASTLARLELELAAMELKKKVAALGIGIGLGAGALVMLVFGLGFAYATIAAALATFMPTWLALLCVTAFLFLKAGVLGLLALRNVKKGTPPVPQQAIEEARRTTEALKNDGNA